MTIVYDMATGSIQSEQEQVHSDTNCARTEPATALQAVQETGCEDVPESVSIHLIRALLDRH